MGEGAVGRDSAPLEDCGLFDVPQEAYVVPPAPENLSRSEKRKRLIAKRIATGEHPLGYPVMLHPDASHNPYHDGTDTPRCGTCQFRVTLRHHDRTYPKCWYPDLDKYPHPRDSHSESSDIRAWWPACQQYRKDEVSA
jgi:hypothetical protein